MIDFDPRIPYNPYDFMDFYRFYRVSSTEKGKPKYIRSTAKSVVMNASDIVLELLMTGEAFKMPGKLGRLTIKRREVNYKNPMVDYERTAIKGKKIYKLHPETDGWFAKIVWGPLNFLKNKTLFVFIPTRKMKDSVNDNFKTHYRDFIPVGIYDLERLKEIYKRNKQLVKKEK